MKLIEINPNFTDAYHDREIAKVELEDYGGALRFLSAWVVRETVGQVGRGWLE